MAWTWQTVSWAAIALLLFAAEALARGIARDAGLKVTLDWHDDFACTANDAEPTAIMRRVLDAGQELLRECQRSPL